MTYTAARDTVTKTTSAAVLIHSTIADAASVWEFDKDWNCHILIHALVTSSDEDSLSFMKSVRDHAQISHPRCLVNGLVVKVSLRAGQMC